MKEFNQHVFNPRLDITNIQQQYFQNIPDDETPKQGSQEYQINHPIQIKYGYQDEKSLVFQINYNFPQQNNFTIGVDLIFLIDIGSSMDDETLEKIKYSLICLVNRLSDQDRLCIILNKNQVEKLFPFTPLNQQNKEIILKKIGQINNQKGNSNILTALLVTYQCLKLRQFKNQVSAVNIIIQESHLKQYCHQIKEIYQNEKSLKLKVFLLKQKIQFQSNQVKQNENQKFGKFYTINEIDQLNQQLCYQTTKLQQTVIKNFLIVIRSHKTNPFNIQECDGGKFLYANPSEIKISKKLVFIGYNKVNLVSVGNQSRLQAGQICDIEVSFQQMHSNNSTKYIIPIYTLNQNNGIIDETVIVQKYKFKSRRQMIEAMLFFEPYKIQDCTQIIKQFQFEIENLPDVIKQQLQYEIQQFQIVLQKFTQDPQKQIEKPFFSFDNQKKEQKLLPYQIN